jgi:hypothetical protein
LGGLVTDTISLATPVTEALGEVAAAKLDVLSATNGKFHNLLNKQYASELTPQIQEKDQLRDALFSELKRTAKSGSMSSLPAIAASGKRIVALLAPFWNLDKKPIMSQTDEIEIFQKRYAADPTYTADISNLGLASQLQRLFTANTDLFNLYDMRAHLLVDVEGTPSATSIKNELVRDYDEFCLSLETILSVLPSAALHGLFTEMNSVRRKYISKLPTPLDAAHTSVAPIPSQVRTGRHLTPLPRVFVQAGGELHELVFAVDFTVTYRNNVEVGEAHLFVHGKGKYTGRYDTTFHIVES